MRGSGEKVGCCCTVACRLLQWIAVQSSCWRVGREHISGRAATVRSVVNWDLAAMEAREQPELRQVMMQGDATRGGEVV